MSSTRTFSRERDPFDQPARYKYLTIAIAVVFVVLLCRLWYLQVVRGEYYAKNAIENRVTQRLIPPLRGRILDRNGMVLVENRPRFDVVYAPKSARLSEGVIRRLAFYLGLDTASIEERVQNARAENPKRPVKIKGDLLWEELALLETNSLDLSDVHIDTTVTRYYPHKALAAHLLGYIGEIDARRLNDWMHLGYRQGDQVGKYGLEKAWEHDLRGHRGLREIEVNALGRKVKLLNLTPARPGQNLVLTIDYRLQRIVEEAFLNYRAGAAVALDPNSGEVLAMYSKPGFHPQDFAGGISPTGWKELVDNELHPLTNRVIQGQYPPGSVFKLVSAVMAVEEGLVKPEQKTWCPGYFTLSGHTYRDWKRTGHGHVDLHRAIVESCDVYFYKIGQKSGIDLLAEYGRSFGLGRPTGVNLPGEKPGLMPSSAWKRRALKERWYAGETISAIIGQGYILVTPMQVAAAYAALANGGTLYRPKLLMQVTDGAGEPVREYPAVRVGRVKASPGTLARLRRAFRGVVHEEAGTARRSKLAGDIEMGGKTGTAQVISLSQDPKEDKEIPYEQRDHAWFVGFAPVEKPELVVVVLVEHGEHGSTASAPIVKRIMDGYFSLKEQQYAVRPTPAAQF